MRYAISTLVVFLAVSLAGAQQYLPQSGNLFDANPQLGSGGANNFTRPVSPLIRGNALTTGNMRFGASFQGRSTISDPTAFRSRLGSSTLSAFRRDSFGGIDQSRFSTGGLGGGFNQTFFDRTTTAPTAGFLRGFTGGVSRRPIGSETRRVTPFVGINAGRVDSRIDSNYQPPAPLGTGLDNSDQLGAPNAASAIFRFHRPQERGLDLTRPSGPFDRDAATQSPQTPAWIRQPGQTRPSVSQLLNNNGNRTNRLDAILGDEPANSLLLNTRLDTRLDETSLRPHLIEGAQPLPDEVPLYPIASRPSVLEADETPMPVDPSALPGFDLYSDMRIALELSRDPSAGWYRQMRESALASSALEGRQLELATQEAEEFVQRLLSVPLTSFVGEGRTVVNNELLKAESLMEIGHFYEAAQRYEAAAAIEPGNPLPLLGHANALLAAGEYNSAAHALVRSIQRFPDIASFRFDLKALLGSGEIVDIRRADLISRLEDFDDPRLRLLLGYLEFHGGLPDKGRENLAKAAEDAGAGSLIARYVEKLEALPQQPVSVPVAQPRRTVERETPAVESRPAPSRRLVVPPKPED